MKNPNDGKIENFLEKAVFTLHPTFDNHVRTVTRAPFKIAEQGYGSFSIKIDLYFKVLILMQRHLLISLLSGSKCHIIQIGVDILTNVSRGIYIINMQFFCIV